MPPKVAKTVHDDVKSEAHAKEKNGQGSAGHHHHHHGNGKTKKAAHTTPLHPREGTAASVTTSPGNQETPFQGIQWSTFDRKVLHAYRREYKLTTPSTFTDPYRQLVLCQAGSIGLYSPTMARRKDAKRQSKDELATTIRKHFNAVGIQENEVIAGLLHKVKHDGVSKRRRRPEQIPLVGPKR